MDKNKVIEGASKLIAKGQLDKAAREYQRVLEVDPDDVRVLQKLAELYQKMQRREDAADCFEKVAKTYSAQGFYLKAVALYKQVLKVVDRIEVNVRLAELYQQLGLVGDATKEWQNVAAYYEKVGDLKASLDTLKKLVDLDPDNVAARIRLGEQYARQDNLVEAVAELRRAAAYLQRNGRQDDYIRVAERISHLDQGDVTLAKELAESYLSKGDSKRALAKLQICFKANPRDLATLQMLARAFQELGQTSKTVSVLKELARVHADANNVDEAKRVFKQALELAPDDAELKGAIKQLEAAAEPPPAPSNAIPLRPPTGPIQARPSTGPIQAQRPTTGPITTDPVVSRTGAVGRPSTGPIAPPPPVQPVSPPLSAPPPSTGPVSVVKLLKETEVYVKYGLHEKALEHLRKIFAAEPENAEAHEKAKQLALVMNRPADAAASLAILVRLYAARSDSRADAAKAASAQIDPANPALSIGPSLEPAPSAEEEVVDEFDDDTSVDMAPPSTETLAEQAQHVDADAPHASDDAEVVEEFDVDDDERTSVDAAPPVAQDDSIDPFAVTDEEQLEAAVVTGEVFVDDSQEVVDAPEPELAARGAAPSLSLQPETQAAAAAAAEIPPIDEDDAFASDLAEADFYIDAGLIDDARGILEGILLAEDHPGARARLASIGGATPPAPAPAPIPPVNFGDDESEHTQLDARPPVTPVHDDLANELAAELASEVAGLDADPNVPLDTGPLDPFQVPASDVLGEFRAKVQETVRPEDAQTHYDLGIAYKEMGLLDEAIAEFELALTHGGGVRKVDCISMLGGCAMEKGRPEEAVKVFLRGLSERDVPEEAKRSLMFDLAVAYEAIGETGLALEQYQNVERAEPGYRDVAARITRLGGTISAPIKKTATVKKV
ncbi:MAG: tetratricopeptide repeat protein, partial [Deltaproteobacteria bacterium]|nr:tetratricopeptide repeat protein [Deltaproteobacteria bacterium]